MGCNASKDGSQPKAIGKAAEQPAAAATTAADADKKKLPHVAQKAPYKVELKEGETYYWCSCGLSKSQPFCDGSHKGTEFNPQAFTYDKPTGDAYLCGCKNNKAESKPYCDGTHKNIDW
ncbi:hypothetical protein FGO68_gene547 [Halteria grandinella]|uniref:Iron-binding zinc finger CDGSH type domain-containing protein n=1 Tax=Halteria grandinella TaxID=5974 RepID=A0A8J8NWB8_HALGN|nr:hypothetical protein FGO68_gene547 [Halteria grandinella]